MQTEQFEIRKMQPEEKKEVIKVASKAFGLIESAFIGKPKEALVATLNGEIVGGIIVKYICSKTHKIGYFDGAFIHPDYHGKGIGSALYKATTEYLWEQGCTAQAAFVKDDNVASWKLFLNNGFSRVSFFEGAKRLGLSTMMKYYFNSPFFICVGMEFYLLVKETTLEEKPKSIPKNILFYLSVNALLVLLGAFGSNKDYPMYIAAYLTVLTSSVLFSFIGTLFSKRNWYFRLNSGGAFLCAVLSFFGSRLPMIGAWYPEKYENTKEFKKDIGLVALFGWIGLLIVTFIACFFSKSNSYINYIRILGALLLVYRAIPIYPFETFDSGRVYRWNKWLYAIMIAISVSVLLFAGNIVK